MSPIYYNKWNNKRVYLWTNHINYLTQYILKEHRLLGHAFHSMQLLLIKELHFIPCQNSISIQIYALEPNENKLMSQVVYSCLYNEIYNEMQKYFIIKPSKENENI